MIYLLGAIDQRATYKGNVLANSQPPVDLVTTLKYLVSLYQFSNPSPAQASQLTSPKTTEPEFDFKNLARKIRVGKKSCDGGDECHCIGFG